MTTHRRSNRSFIVGATWACGFACTLAACYLDRPHPGSLGVFPIERHADASPEDASPPRRDASPPRDAATRDASPADAAVVRRDSGAMGMPAEWLMEGASLDGTYHQPDERKLNKQNAATLHEVWRIELSGTQHGPPLMVGGDMVFANAGDEVQALRVGSGEKIWTMLQSAGAIATNALAFEDGRVYAQQQNGDTLVLDGFTGLLHWFVASDMGSVGSGDASPIIRDDVLLLGRSFDSTGSSTDFYNLHARKKGDGVVLWSSTLAPADGVSITSTPVVDSMRGSLFASAAWEHADKVTEVVAGFDLQTGMLLWTQQQESTAGDRLLSSDGQLERAPAPLLFRGTIDRVETDLIATRSRAGDLRVFDRHSGQLMWDRSWFPVEPGADSVTNLALAVHRRGCMLLAGVKEAGDSGQIRLIAADCSTGEIVWELMSDGKVLGGITLTDEVAFIGIDDELIVLDIETGSRLTTLSTGGPQAIFATPANGYVALGTGSRGSQDASAQPALIMFEIDR
jgi:outer membrane protein assembly factor BamB